MKQKRIFVIGDDNIGWSISHDRYHLLRALNQLNVNLTKNPFMADIIYCVWWNLLDSWKYRFFRHKRIIATVTNDLVHQTKILNRIKSMVDIWVCANKKQMETLLSEGVQGENIKYSPFYVDESVFKSNNLNKLEIAKSLDIDYGLIDGKILIGNFQRDSLGTDLTKPKWQKDPDLLISVLKTLNSEDYLLVLAGPRRHYIIKQCEKYTIPYLFVGSLPPVKGGADDIRVNTLSLQKINMLYNVIDIYMVSSKSEGGPKAVIESVLTKTSILSTKVGMAPDLLEPFVLYDTKDEALEKIKMLTENAILRDKLISKNYENMARVNSFSAYTDRIKQIIESIL